MTSFMRGSQSADGATNTKMKQRSGSRSRSFEERVKLAAIHQNRKKKLGDEVEVHAQPIYTSASRSIDRERAAAIERLANRGRILGGLLLRLGCALQ